MCCSRLINWHAYLITHIVQNHTNSLNYWHTSANQVIGMGKKYASHFRRHCVHYDLCFCLLRRIHPNKYDLLNNKQHTQCSDDSPTAAPRIRVPVSFEMSPAGSMRASWICARGAGFKADATSSMRLQQIKSAQGRVQGGVTNIFSAASISRAATKWDSFREDASASSALAFEPAVMCF